MAESSTDKSVFVVTFPLKTEKWQEDRIDKMMRQLTVLYNDKQEILLKRYIHLSHSPEFKAAKEEGTMAYRKYMQDNGFSKFEVEKVFADSSRKKSVTSEQLSAHGLNSIIIQELSHRAWNAWEKKLYGNGKKVASKRDGDHSPIVNTLKSRLVGGSVIGFRYSMETFSLTMSATKPKKHDIFTCHFEVNPNSEYELFALHQEMRNIAITRKMIRGKYKYYVQFSLAGTPYNKGRELGLGVVGIDPGPSKVAVVSDTEVRVIPLAAGIERDEREARRLMRKLDRSRRATNPDNYNEDGTIRRGIKLSFEKSNTYKRAQAQLADTHRKLAAKRKIAHNILANEMLTQGNEFRVEKNSFKSMQSRAKETRKNARGKNMSKRRFGRSLANYAPSEFLTILENKVRQYPDGVFVEIPASTACTQYDFTSGDFTKHEINERIITTSDGHQHDRDALAAFNMKFVRTEKVAGKKKIEKSDENFDTQAMAEFYPQFCRMENKIKLGVVFPK